MSTLSSGPEVRSRRRLTIGGDLPDNHNLSRSRADGTTRRLTTSLEGKDAKIDDSFQQELEMVYTTANRGRSNNVNAFEIGEDPRYHGPPSSRNNINRWRGMITFKTTSILLAVASVLVYLCIPAATVSSGGIGGSSVGGGSSTTKQPLISGFNTAIYDEPPPFDEDPPPLINEQHQDSLIAAQFTTDPYANRNHMEMILSGELGLAGLRYHPTSFANSSSNDGKEKETSSYYTGVYGEFCVFNTQLNKNDPSYYPTIKDVMSESAHCGENIGILFH